MILFMQIEEEVDANWEPKDPKKKQREELSVQEAFDLMHKQDGTKEGKKCDSSGR